jgi:hypothetical protein
MSTPDFHALFSRLSSTDPPVTSPLPPSSEHLGPIAAAGDLNASITGSPSPVPAPPSATRSGSNMASPSQGAAPSGNDRAQTLLSLLRFSQASPEDGGQQPGQPGRTSSTDMTSNNTPHEHKTTETELVKGSATPSAREERGSGLASSIIPAPDARDSQTSSGAEENPQEALRRLLNRSQLTVGQSGQSGISEPRVVGRNAEDELQQDPISAPVGGKSPMTAPQPREDSPFRLSSGRQSRGSNPVGAPQAENAPARKEHKPLFTYTNPFEALNASRAQSIKPQASQSRTSSPTVGVRENNTALSLLNGDKRESKNDSPEPASAKKNLTTRAPIHPLAATQHVVEDHTSAKHAESVANHSKERRVLNEATETSHESDNAKSARGDGLDNTNDASSQPPATELKVTKRNETVPDSEIHGRPAHVPQRLARDADDAWESVEESPAKGNPTRVVPVYNFPIKPFVSITLKPSPPSRVTFRDDGVMDISRYKKEFDQLDRSLAAATSKYIAYALVKSGGIRIIRQEDGIDRQAFKNSHDRIFSVAMCSTASSSTPSEYQAVLGVGVSGSVYYATISKEGQDLFEDDMLDSESLIFPQFPLADENTSGGVLKTRAKKSSRHPEFFAIGRGKSIHLVWPATAMSTKYGVNGSDRKVDVEKLYNDRCLKITTGKAGKDFAFSEDDTLIVSLDKTGRLRFWDIRSLVEESNATASKVAPIDVRMPLLTLATASPTEKSWPTSVLFIDKLRPYTKVAALRYVLVGLRQNHTLQLWDIAIGKAVQELNFPHETETDGICSVSYHPNSGIIVVGHPTRNSIYFIHLSAPRYSLVPMTQAAYVEKLAADDPDLPKPDSTACMSGIREISFAAKGQLRSVELLPVHKGPEVTKEMADGLSLFELYVVHSKGVTCLTIRKDDLGWSSDGKVLNPVNATDEGLITLKDLRLGAVVNEAVESAVVPDEVPPPTKTGKKKPLKKTVDMADGEREPIANIEAEISPATAAAAAPPAMAREGQVNGAKASPAAKVETSPEKETKRSKKKTAASNIPTATNAEATPESSSRNISPSKTPSTVVPHGPDTSTANTTEAPHTPARTPGHTNSSVAQGDAERVTVGISGDWLDRELKKVEKAVAGEFRKELTDLYQNIQNDRNVQDSAAVARQEAVLRLISTTLSTNVEKSLGRIILTQMQQVVAPSITGVTVQAVSAQVGEAIARVLHQLVPHELGTQLPVAISTAMQNPQISRHISETVSQKVASQVESHMADLLRTTITPAFKNLASSVAEQAAVEVENRLGAQIRQIQTDRANDSIKIDSLHQALNGIAETLQAISATQAELQNQFLRDRQQLVQLSGLATPSSSHQISTARQQPAPIAPPTPTKPRSQDEIEDEEIAKLMDNRRYEEASIRWLQSSKPVELFDKLFVRFTPDYLATDVSPLVAFSVGITVGNSLSTNTARRLDWIKAAFEAVDLRVSTKPMFSLFQFLIANSSGILYRILKLPIFLNMRQL